MDPELLLIPGKALLLFLSFLPAMSRRVAGEERRKGAGTETISNVPGLQTNQYFPSSKAVPLIFMSRRNSCITEAQKREGKGGWE